MELAVLLKHEDTSSGSTITRYALKVDSITISIAKTPIQIPIPQNSPALVDFGIFRPAITLSAVVDTGPANDTTEARYEGMESIVHGGDTWYIPYKNKLEDAIYTWVADNDNVLRLIIGDDTYPVYDKGYDGSNVAGTPQATGGASYVVALQQCRFQLDAGREDRWIVQMQFVCESRFDTKTRIFP